MKKSANTSELLAKKYRKRSKMGEIFHRIKSNKGSMIAMIILIILFLTFLASLFISYESVTVSNVKDRLFPPSWQYPFGTDNMGRDAFLRVVYGTRYSITIGFGVIAIALLFGTLFGAIAGYYGGNLENIIMRISDVLASVPGILLSMVIMTVLGQSLLTLIIACGIPTIPNYIRVTRASVLTVKDNEFVESARAIGFSDFRIIFSEVLPNGLSPVIVATTTSLGMAIIGAAGLSYLGLGVPVPQPEWGSLISTGREFARSAPWLMTFPGFSIMIVVLAFNLLGDGLRDALDPKLKK